MKVRQSGFVIRFFTTDIARKLLSLFIAILLYAYVSSRNGERQELRDIPVKVELPAGKLLIGEAPVVTLQISYNKTLRTAVNPSEVQGNYVVSEREIIPGSNRVEVPLNEKDFNVPIGARIHAIKPKKLILTVENQIVRDVPVEARFKDVQKMPKDYRIGKVTFNPAKVRLTGPESLVNQATGVRTKPIPVDGSTTYAFDFRADLNADPGVSVTPSQVMAYILVEKSRGERSVPNVPLAILNSSGKFRTEILTSPNIEVKIAGPKGIVESFPMDRIHGFCDLSGLKEPGIQTVNTGCFLERGNGLEVLSIYPEKVKVKISR